MKNLKEKTLTFVLSSLSLTNTFGQHPGGQTKVVAITEIVSHPSLEAAREGALGALQALGYEEGKNLKVLFESAQGDISLAASIAKKFAHRNPPPDVIIPISTPSAQTVLKATAGLKQPIPIVFSSVSDPVGAGLVKDLQEKNGRIIGIMDSPNLHEELEVVKEVVPNLKTLGLLYNAGEANSAKTIAALKSLAGKSVRLEEVTIVASRDLGDAVRTLVNKQVQAIFIPLDNTVNSAIAQLIKLCKQYKVPVFTCDPGNVKMGAFACYGYSQTQVGYKAGVLAGRILKGERISDLRIETPGDATVYINRTTAQAIGIPVPEKIKGRKVEFYD